MRSRTYDHTWRRINETISDPRAAYEECARMLDPVSCQPLFLLNDFFPTDDLGFGDDEQGAFF